MKQTTRLPAIIPFIDHKYRRSTTLDEPVVALSLYEIVNPATGELHVTAQEELAARFRIPVGAMIVLSGVGKDPPIERWWELTNRPALLAGLRKLGITLFICGRPQLASGFFSTFRTGWRLAVICPACLRGHVRWP